MVRHAFVSHRRTEEALTWVQRGRELDPLAISGVDIGWILFQARRYDDAFALWLLGFALIANNQAKEAIPVLEKALSGSDRSPGVIGVLIRAYAHAGRTPFGSSRAEKAQARRVRSSRCLCERLWRTRQ